MKRFTVLALILVGCVPPSADVDSGFIVDAGRPESDSGIGHDAGRPSVDSGTILDANPCSWNWDVQAEPVLRGPRNVASDPSVVMHEGRWVMAFSSLDVASGDNLIAVSESSDGEHWGPPHVVLRGSAGSWAEEVESADLIVSSSGPRLYFSGYRSEVNQPLCSMYGICSEGFPASMALARGFALDAGAVFAADSDIVLRGTDGGFDGEATYSPTIEWDPVAARWVMLYSGWCLRNCNSAAKGFLAMLGATSTDGLTWVKHATPLLERDPAVSWRNRAVGESSVVRLPNGRWVMAFTAFTDDRLPDTSLALAWSQSNPLGPYTVCPAPLYLPKEFADGGGIESGGVIAPELLLVGSEVKMWFTSRNLSATTDFGYFVRSATAH